MSDLRAAYRLLFRRPGFCAAIALTLAIALGAATAIFSLLYAIVLRPLPFPDADRLVAVTAVVAGDEGRLTLREYRELARDTRLFDGWGAYYRSQYNVTGGGPPEAFTCTIGSSTLFRVLGIAPAVGELWPEAQDFTRQYNAVLSHRVWQQRFGGRADVIGSTITMDGGAYRVLGVLPRGVDYPLRTDVYRAVTDYNAPHVRRYSAVARLRRDATPQSVQTELDAFAAKFAKEYPDTNAGVALRATPLRDAYVGPARPFIWLMTGAVALLLVIACVNVTNLLLSRALMASGESAVRLALGANRWHLVRQSLVEALLLTFIGTSIGVVGARGALRALTAMVHRDLPPWFAVDVDATVLLFAAAAAWLTAIAVGVLPALQASRSNVERVLRQETSRTAGGRRQQVGRRAMLAGQAAFATTLLVTSGIFVSGLRGLLRVDTGFDSDRLLTFRVDPPYGRYPDIRTTSEFYRRAIETLVSLPGVEAAGANNVLPFSGLDSYSARVAVEGHVSGRPDEEPFANVQLVDPGYFHAMRIPMRSGRAFAPTDLERSTPVAIVSERAARRFWGTDDPLGRRLRIIWNQRGRGGGGGASDVWLTVVGVAGNVRFNGLEDDGGLDLYAPNMQLFAGDSYLVVRTKMDANALGPQLRAAIDRIDPDQSLFDVQTMEERVDGSIWPHRVAGAVLAMFSAIALCLAVIGTYAMTSYAVAAQRHEIGIRLALGSSSSQAGWLMMRRCVTPVLAGTLVGFGGGLVVAHQLEQIIGTGSANGWAMSAALPAVLAAAAVTASYLPVRRIVRRVSLTLLLGTTT
jgi:putative ABC transport system permease protein